MSVASFGPSELKDAVLTGSAFWDALAADDDERLIGLLSADALAVLGLDTLEAGRVIARPDLLDPFRPPGPLVAARLRDYLGFSARDCGRMGLFSVATILDEHALRLSYSIADEPRRVEAGDLIEGRRIELQLDEGRWLVDPIRAHDRPGIATVDLGPLFS